MGNLFQDLRYAVRQLRKNLAFIVLWGGAVGVVLALAASRVLEGFLFGVQGFDVITYVSVILVLLATATAAAYVPARRVAGVDPMVALRNE